VATLDSQMDPICTGDILAICFFFTFAIRSSCLIDPVLLVKNTPRTEEDDDQGHV
jgi:hypothetical protein